MISYRDLVLMLLVHFLADAALQTDKQAKMKSTDFEQLGFHILTYSSCIFLMALVLYGDIRAVTFTIVTGFAHLFTDYCSSRIGKPYWEAKDYHNGFLIVVADQILHILQLTGLHILLK